VRPRSSVSSWCGASQVTDQNRTEKLKRHSGASCANCGQFASAVERSNFNNDRVGRSEQMNFLPHLFAAIRHKSLTFRDRFASQSPGSLLASLLIRPHAEYPRYLRLSLNLRRELSGAEPHLLARFGCSSRFARRRLALNACHCQAFSVGRLDVEHE
jgi:hypothetical protein